MLYITTRDKTNSYTAMRTLNQDRGTDGGFFVPFQMPSFSREEILGLKDKSFGQCVADILNRLFSARMDGWEVECAIGRNLARLTPMSHRILVAEPWHNPDWDFSWVVRNLSAQIRGGGSPEGKTTDWAFLGVRIAVLFGLFGELQRNGVCSPEDSLDVAVPTGDFSQPMAVWYARAMGLPVGTIICGCNENGGLWDLLHHGQLHTGGVAEVTGTPEGDAVVPAQLERLIFTVLGREETEKFLDVCRRGGVYAPGEWNAGLLRAGLYAAVVSGKRVEATIYKVSRAAGYIFDPYGALAYSGLQDYRATTGESGCALILTERSPMRAGETVARATNLTVEELKQRLPHD